jgi:hypothetical protein
MMCSYHVGTRLVASTQQRIPFDAELADTPRTTLYCPVAGCRFVAIDYDRDRVDKQRCYSCGGPLRDDSDDSVLTTTRCTKCKHRDQKKYRKRQKMLHANTRRGRPAAEARHV